LHDAIPVSSIHAVVQVPRGQEEGHLLVNVNRPNPKGRPISLIDDNPKRSRMNRLTAVLQQHLGDGAPTGDAVMDTIGKLCGRKPSTHWIDIVVGSPHETASSFMASRYGKFTREFQDCVTRLSSNRQL
jgi:hypothetical protein